MTAMTMIEAIRDAHAIAMERDDRVVAFGEDVGVTKEAVAIKKGDSDTAKAVQAAMQKLMDDGTYMKILKHWGVESGALDKAEIKPTDLD